MIVIQTEPKKEIVRKLEVNVTVIPESVEEDVLTVCQVIMVLVKEIAKVSMVLSGSS